MNMLLTTQLLECEACEGSSEVTRLEEDLFESRVGLRLAQMTSERVRVGCRSLGVESGKRVAGGTRKRFGRFWRDKFSFRRSVMLGCLALVERAKQAERRAIVTK
jgi:hypothetical protein